MQILYVWFLCQKWKKGKRWKMERNKHHRAGWASCFIWRIEAQYHYSPVITQESRVREKKTRPFLPLFFLSFTQFLSLSTSYISLPFLSLSSYSSHSLYLSSVPWGHFLIHLQAPKRPQHAAQRDCFSLFGVKNKSAVGVSLDSKRFLSAPLWKKH